MAVAASGAKRVAIYRLGVGTLEDGLA